MTLTVTTTKTTNNRNAYDFVSRGTHYTVIDGDGINGDMFTVFSERKSASFGVQIAVMTLNEMKERSKALANLATLITA